MENKTASRPPYPSTGQADEILDIFRRISPKRIDSKFVAENKIATAPNASSVVNFVRWLGITDSEGNVKEEVASKLRLVGDERDKFIAGLIKTAYKEILEGVNLQQARREDLINFFIHNYNYGIAPAKSASILLLHLCEKYGIPVSDELKKKTHMNTAKTDNKPEKKKKTAKKEQIESEVISIGDNKYVINIKGQNTNQTFVVNNLSDIEDVEAILTIIKKKLA